MTAPVPDIIEAIDQCDWLAVIVESPRRACWDYSDQFYSAARQAEANDDRCQAVLDLLAQITSLEFQFGVRNQPFEPLSLLDGISESDLAVLAEWVDQVHDPELRARLKDLAWVRLRNHQLGRDAIEDYLLSAKALGDAEDWILAERRIERALRLAAELRDQAGTDAVVDYIETMLDEYEPQHEVQFLGAFLMKLLLEFRRGDADRLSSLAEGIAVYAEADQHWDRARKHWLLKARWDDQRDQVEVAHEARKRAAETHVLAANEALAETPPNHLLASIEVLRAVEALRQLGESTRAEELHREALAYQRQARAQAQTFSVDFDFTDEASSAKAAVASRPLHDALLILARMGQSPSVDNLRKEATEQAQEFPFLHMIAAFPSDGRGRVIARRPPMSSDDEIATERVLEASMLDIAEYLRGGQVIAYIEPARRRILLDHRPRIDDLLDLIVHSPFIPAGRELVFAEGLHAGLLGDFVVAGHLLFPQMENSIRYLLDQRGVVTSSLTQEGIQEDLDINALLSRRRSDVVALFGDDLTFNLRGLLVERWGANLRNRMAHGLMDYAAFSSPQVAYLWWLTLHLCCWHIPDTVQDQDSSSTGVDEPNSLSGGIPHDQVDDDRHDSSDEATT